MWRLALRTMQDAITFHKSSGLQNGCTVNFLALLYSAECAAGY